jgi:hypothetical protein
MPPFNKKWLSVLWVALGATILAFDYWTGPNIVISYLFLIPVALAAHYNGRFLGITLALVLPFARFCFHYAWDNPLSLWDSVLNAVIRIAILVGAAYLIDLVNRQAQEIKILRGILPICMYCKKIRTPEHQWQQLEKFITEHSQAQFSHTFCPECGKKYYAEMLGEEEDLSPKPPGPTTTEK